MRLKIGYCSLYFQKHSLHSSQLAKLHIYSRQQQRTKENNCLNWRENDKYFCQILFEYYSKGEWEEGEVVKNLFYSLDSLKLVVLFWFDWWIWILIVNVIIFLPLRQKIMTFKISVRKASRILNLIIFYIFTNTNLDQLEESIYG